MKATGISRRLDSGLMRCAAFAVGVAVTLWACPPGTAAQAAASPGSALSALTQAKVPPQQDPPTQEPPKQGEQKKGDQQDKNKKDNQDQQPPQKTPPQKTTPQDDKKKDDSKKDDVDKADRQKKLDKDLFDDLGGGLFDGLGDPKTDQEKPKDDPNANLFDDLGAIDGEDVGQGGDPLVRIGQRMRAAELLLKESQSGLSIQELQQQIAADLDRLIAAAEQQQQQESQNSQSEQDNSGQENSAQSGGNPQPGQTQGEPQQSTAQSQAPGQAAQDSSPQPRPAGPDSASMAAIRDLMEKTPWGDLPERIRQTMLQSPTEQMLPEYAEQIREYFKQLAKRRGQ